VKDRARFRAQLEALAAIPGLRRVIVSHRVIDEDPAGTLRRVAASL
jgi:hypothetical protein